MLRTFFDQLAQRIAVLAAKLLSTSFETLQVSHEADHQNQLEDLARSYEEDGKPEIAANVRRQASQLSSTNLAGQSVEILADIAGNEPARIAEDSQPRLVRLPEVGGTPAKSRRKKPSPNRKKSNDV